MVLVIDYGMGNLRSVANALEAAGAKVRLSSRPEELKAAERIVLPGVGAFGEAMERLRRAGLLAPLAEAVLGEETPFLGICLGMQLLAERGFEHGEHQGLGWIPGEVRRLEPADPALRVPHVGWNSVRLREGSRLFARLQGEPAFYFVHSFHLIPSAPEVAAGVCEYGGEIVAAVERGNIFGTQFHPEKSHKEGLLVLKNFLSFG